jgi:hypothetical protein
MSKTKSKRMTATGGLAFLTVVFAMALMAGTAMGQAESGQIIGKVADPNGAVVPGAAITLKSVNTGREITATANDEGVYSVTNLQPGLYDLTVTGGNFKPNTQRVQVTVGSRISVDTVLGLAEVAVGTVDVVASGGVEVNTQEQQLSSVVSGTQLRELPTITRNPYDLVGISGNVSGEGQVENASGVSATSRGAGYAINGQRAASTNILLDGGENVNAYLATVGQKVPLDSVGEFRVITSNFSAEYGRASGGIVNVTTRSGGNEFHGSVYEFNRNSKLASNSFNNNANAIPKGHFNRNQFGYSIGGPVLKNKLFFFSSTEWIRVRSNAESINLVPTTQLLAASYANTRNFFTAFPLATQINGRILTVNDVTSTLGGAAAGFTPANAFAALPSNLPAFGEVHYSIPQDVGGGSPQNGYQTVNRGDWNINNKSQLFGRYAIENRLDFPGFTSASPYTGFNTGQTTFNQNVLVSLTHAFSPRLGSETKLVFNRLSVQDPLNGTPTPTLYFFPGTGAQIGNDQIALPGYLPFTPGNGLPFGGPQNLGQVYEDLSFTTGKHTFRFGGNYVYIQDNRVFGAYATAVESLGNQGSYSDALGNFVQGQLRQFQGAIDPQGKFPGQSVTLPVGPPSFDRSNRYNEFAAYINDSYRVNPRLTLNMGLRYEYYGVQHNKDQQLDSNFYFGQGTNLFEQIRNGSVQIAPDSSLGKLWKPDKNNFAPRVGFAWDMFGDGKTSLRGGYGIAYERNFGNVTFNVIQNPPSYTVLSIISQFDTPGFTPITLSNSGPLAGSSGSKIIPAASLRYVRNDIANAYAHFWSGALEREISKGTVASVEYSGSAGRKLYSIENINRSGTGLVYLGSLSTNPFTGVTSDRLNGQYTNINTRGNNGMSNYNALIASLQSNDLLKLGLQLTARYTYAVAKDNLSSTFSDSPGNVNLGLTDPFNPKYDYGHADFDVRHRLSLSYNWEIPLFKETRGVARQVLTGWSFTGIFNVRTGFPFTVFDCTNAVTTCNRIVPVDASGNPVQIKFSGSGNPAPVAGAPNLFNYIDLSNVVPGAFANPTTGTSEVGPYPTNSPRRNAFRGPGFWNFDVGLYKTFKVNEKYRIQFRGEFFNLFNHSNLFASINQNDVSSFSFIGGVRGVNTQLNPAVLAAREERRNVQLAVKFIF